ncbi:hypothetical protein JVT61DRAFT_12231 [Boletus reticuloceps]|uniref:Uncharacterized protein n=1 Tax=Boletus reticuloceps TaxID=495285 RepID=A0A8I3A524_9AGAM|nr:hypothetical protein JVT61DRAFT_12231 [Boletus reticuloceps]
MASFTVPELRKIITSVNEYLIHNEKTMSAEGIEYLKLVRQTLQGATQFGISSGDDFQWVESTPGTEKEHEWLQLKKKWVKGSQGTSSSTATNAVQERVTLGKRSANGEPEGTLTRPDKRRREDNVLSNYHAKLLRDLVKGREELEEIVDCLKLSLQIIRNGGPSRTLEHHLERLEKAVANNDSEISMAASMLVDSVKYL